MNFKMKTGVAVALMAGTLCASVPELDNVTVAQNAHSREVTIDFTLSGEPGVVTVDVLTNGTSIGYANMKGFVGDIYRVLQPTAEGQTHHISWRPDVYWPEGGHIADDSVQFVLTAWATNAPPEWLVADLLRKCVYFYPDPELFPAGPDVTNHVYKVDYLVMRKIRAAGKSFIMGEFGNKTAGAVPQRSVSFTKDYYISIFNFTDGQWDRIVSGNVSDLASNENKRKPKVNVGRGGMLGCADLAAAFFPSFSPGFGLLTSAQMEYACRAGTIGTRFCPNNKLGDYAWYYGNSGGSVHEVGTRKPNPWGLYDMVGNVVEGTADTGTTLTYSTEPVLDPAYTADTGTYVIRGGGYSSPDTVLVSHNASQLETSIVAGNLGFRLGWTLP